MFAGLAFLTAPVEASQPSGYDLAAAVNAYRAANGYYTLAPNELVMSAAQTHAEWIVSSGQGGHIGAGGSDETVRVSWTGYGGGAAIQCDENWAGGRSIEDALYGAWSDWVHQEVMLNAWGNLYTDIGGGVAARGDGSYVFVLNVCKVIGQEASGAVPSSGATTPGAAATADLSNYIYGVTRATPLADGSIRHTVLYGQSLAAIAEAYGVAIEALRELNGMAAGDTLIYPEQELLIQAGAGGAPTQPTAAPQAEASPSASPTAEEAPHRPTSAHATPIPLHTATPAAADPQARFTRSLGLLLVGVSVLGLAVIVLFSFVKK